MNIRPGRFQTLRAMKVVPVAIFFLFLGSLNTVLVEVSCAETPPGRLRLLGQESYDPYLIASSSTSSSLKERSKEAGGSAKNPPAITRTLSSASRRQQRELYDPFYFVPGNGGYLRNRRNSLTAYGPYPREGGHHRDVEYLYERNTKLDDNNIFPDPPVQPVYQYRNPNQFLTKQQITGAQTRNTAVFSRYYSPNAIDYRKPSYYDQGSSYYSGGERNRPLHGYENNGRPQSGEAWSVQVGTQLKVNDDGRERNPEQFYVRDETRRGSSSQRRYSPYYRK